MTSKLRVAQPRASARGSWKTSTILAAAAAIAIVGIYVAPKGGALAQEKTAGGAPPAGTTATARERDETLLRNSLGWLKKQQQENGSYGKIPSPQGEQMGEAGISALALRAFAKASPSLQKELELEPVMDRIATYLIGLQDESGAIANPKSGLTTYRTSIALMALAAYDATLAKPRFATQIGKARAFLVRGQFSEQNLGGDAATAKKNPNFGGWGYDEKTGTQPKADLSNSHFALEALKEAKQVGQHVDDEVWQRAQVFLQRCQNRTESNDAAPAGVEIGDDGGFMYDPALDEGKSTPVVHPDGRKSIPSYASITYAGLMSMLYANVRKDDPRVQGAHKWIEQNYSLEENKGLGAGRPGGGKQGLYYMFHTFAKAMAAWGEPKVKTADGVEHDWAEDLVARLASLERPDGSWSNDTRRWWEDDPVLCTCYAALALEIADVSLGGEAPPALQPYKVEEPPAKKDAKGGDKAKGSGAK